MNIKVRAFGKLLTVLDRKFEVELKDQATVEVLLRRLTELNPSILKPILWDPLLTLLINGRNIHSLQGANTILHHEDTVTLISFVAGG